MLKEQKNLKIDIDTTRENTREITQNTIIPNFIKAKVTEINRPILAIGTAKIPFETIKIFVENLKNNISEANKSMSTQITELIAEANIPRQRRGKTTDISKINEILYKKNALLR